MFKMPFIGPFLESVNPEFAKYYAKWQSGPLSCVSVFHKYAPNSKQQQQTNTIAQIRSHRLDTRHGA
jgi:hypothetical protein